MKVVLYLRVSTEKQVTEGQSIPDQERRARRWAEGGGHSIVATYREAESAWSRRRRNGKVVESAEARAVFARMIAEFEITRPDAIVIDSLDRFTRTLREGLVLLELLRGHHVGLLPMDWDRAHPIDVDDDHDWENVVHEFQIAEGENRRRSRRMIRSYEGRRERGATTCTTEPFGLRRRRDGFEPGEYAWVVNETDRRYLAGEHVLETLSWLHALDVGAWTSRNGLRTALLSEHYVAAGVRTPETAAAIKALLRSRDGRRAGTRREIPHEFAGVFACARCVEQNRDERDSIMGSFTKFHKRSGRWYEAVACEYSQRLVKRHKPFNVSVDRISPVWFDLLKQLRGDEEAIAQWATTGPTAETARKRLHLERSLSRLEQEETVLSSQRLSAFGHLSDPDRSIAAQARKALLEIDAEETVMQGKRDVIRGELAALDAVRRDPERLKAALANFGEIYKSADAAQRNVANRALVHAVGSRPRLQREGASKWADLTVSWPGILAEPIRCPYPAHGERAQRGPLLQGVQRSRNGTFAPIKQPESHGLPALVYLAALGPCAQGR